MSRIGTEPKGRTHDVVQPLWKFVRPLKEAGGGSVEMTIRGQKLVRRQARNVQVGTYDVLYMNDGREIM